MTRVWKALDVTPGVNLTAPTAHVLLDRLWRYYGIGGLTIKTLHAAIRHFGYFTRSGRDNHL